MNDKPPIKPRKRLEGQITKVAMSDVGEGRDLALFGESLPCYCVWDYLYAYKRLQEAGLSKKLKEAMRKRLPELRTYLCAQFINAVEILDVPTLERIAEEVTMFDIHRPPAIPIREKVLRMKGLLDSRRGKMTLANLAIWLDALKRCDKETLDKIVVALKENRLDRPLANCPRIKSDDGHSSLRRVCKELQFPLARDLMGAPKK
jgi:hypothetical protein